MPGIVPTAVVGNLCTSIIEPLSYIGALVYCEDKTFFSHNLLAITSGSRTNMDLGEEEENICSELLIAIIELFGVKTGGKVK